MEGIKLFIVVTLPSPAHPNCLKRWLTAVKLLIRRKMHQVCPVTNTAFIFVSGCQKNTRRAKYPPECSYCIFWGTISFCRTHKTCCSCCRPPERGMAFWSITPCSSTAGKESSKTSSSLQRTQLCDTLLDGWLGTCFLQQNITKSLFCLQAVICWST